MTELCYDAKKLFLICLRRKLTGQLVGHLQTCWVHPVSVINHMLLTFVRKEKRVLLVFFFKSSDNWRLLNCFAVCACNDFAWTWGLGAGCASDHGWWVALCLPVCLSDVCLLICSCLFLCFLIDKGREFSGHGQLWLGTVLFLWKQMLVQLKEKGWLFDYVKCIYIYPLCSTAPNNNQKGRHTTRR